MGDILANDGLAKLVWSECDALLGGVLVASPADARGRGISLAIERDGNAVDLTGAHVYLVWRHRELRRRGCEPFEAVDASAGKFRVFYPAAMASAEGAVDAQVVVSFYDERALSSRAFSIRVEQVLVGDRLGRARRRRRFGPRRSRRRVRRQGRRRRFARERRCRR